MPFLSRKNKLLKIIILAVIFWSLNFLITDIPEANAACSMECKQSGTSCYSNDTTLSLTSYLACVINTTKSNGTTTNCTDGVSGTACQMNGCPTGFNASAANGTPCKITKANGTVSCTESALEPNGPAKWDSSESRCIVCSGKREQWIYDINSFGTDITVSAGNTNFDTACDTTVDPGCDDRDTGYVCSPGKQCDTNGACVIVATATPSPTPTPTPTPGGPWIKYSSGGLRANDCVGGGDLLCTDLNGDTSGCATGWSGCGTGGPSVCMVGFSVDCSDPSLRCATEFMACDCDCITPTPTTSPTVTATSTPTPTIVTIIGCGAGCSVAGPCTTKIGQPLSCFAADATVSYICGLEPTCIITSSSGPNCDCAALPTGTPTVTVSVTATASGTCSNGDGCKLGCLPPDPDCGGGAGLTPGFKPFTSTNSFEALTQNVTGWILGIIGSLALLFLIIGGIMYIGAGGDQDRIKTAKSIITAVIIGLIVVIASYSIINEVKKILGY